MAAQNPPARVANRLAQRQRPAPVAGHHDLADTLASRPLDDFLNGRLFAREARDTFLSECDYVADAPSHLRRHFIARHTKLRFRCAFGCEIWYSSVGNLSKNHLKKKKIHRIRRHFKYYAIPKLLFRDPLPPNASLPVECLSCDMRFKDNADLKFHLVRAHL